MTEAVDRDDGLDTPREAARALSVLVGNGLSVAFNPALQLQNLTRQVMERIAGDQGDGVVAAMKEIAARALPDGITGDEDFEQLVGAFGAESRVLGVLGRLAALALPDNEDLRMSIQTVAQFAEQVRDAGVSHVLEAIFEQSHSSNEEAEHLHSLLRSIVEKFDGRITFGNLNYDTLLLAALMAVCSNRDLADLAHGWKMQQVLVDGTTTRSVPALRRFAADFPDDRRVRLLHLHGSLTYWTDGDRYYVKLRKELLLGGDQWAAVRKGQTTLRPAVVLATPRDKEAHVREYPFSLAYDVFHTSLSASNHWLIMGYSFRDDPVNDMLRTEFLDRRVKPSVLVVTLGSDPSLERVERAFGWGAEDGPSTTWLSFHRGGANGVERHTDWDDFVAT